MNDRVDAAACRSIKFIRIFHRIAVICFLALAGVTTLVPAPAQAQEYTFSSIRIDGNRRVEDSTILSYAGLSRGSSISAGALNDSYQNVLSSGLFEKVEFIPQGNRLLIRVSEFPTINRINFEGNDNIDDEQALALIESRPRRIFSPSQAERDAAALTRRYQNDGRLTASVIPKIIARSDNRVDLVFEVVEGRKVEVERISFVGNRSFSENRLRRVLQTKQAGLLRIIIQSDTFIEERIEFDKRALNDFYQERGYVDFQVLSVSSEFSRERNAFFLTFSVREGQSFDFGKITTTTNLPEVVSSEFHEAVNVRPGQTYSPAAVDAVIARMERLALRKGLNFVRVEPKVTRNARDLTLDVEFALVRAPRIFVERIDVEGNATTLDRIVRQQFRIVEGDPFNPREIREAQDRIRSLGLFGNVAVGARQGSRADQVIVDVDVEEQLTGSLSFGGNYNTSNGVGLTAAFRERNFLGRGQTLNFDISVGFDNGDAGFTFVEPGFLGQNVQFAFTTDYRRTSYDYTNYDTKAIRFQPSFEFPISESTRLGVNYSLSRDSIFNVHPNSSPILKAEEAQGSQITSAFGYSFNYDSRRTGLDPNTGIVFNFAQTGAGLGGDTQFVNTFAELTGETKILNEDVTIRATIEGGVLESFSGASRLNDRFFLNSSKLRGFEPSGVGPRDLTVANEDALGGNYYAVARLETEFPIGLPEEYGLTLGLFADVGSVWGLDNTNGGLVDDSAYLRSVVGVSVFWRTGLGPLRFNFSYPLEYQSYDLKQYFDLTISTNF